MRHWGLGTRERGKRRDSSTWSISFWNVLLAIWSQVAYGAIHIFLLASYMASSLWMHWKLPERRPHVQRRKILCTSHHVNELCDKKKSVYLDKCPASAIMAINCIIPGRGDSNVGTRLCDCIPWSKVTAQPTSTIRFLHANPSWPPRGLQFLYHINVVQHLTCSLRSSFWGFWIWVIGLLNLTGFASFSTCIKIYLYQNWILECSPSKSLLILLKTCFSNRTWIWFCWSWEELTQEGSQVVE